MKGKHFPIVVAHDIQCFLNIKRVVKQRSNKTIMYLGIFMLFLHFSILCTSCQLNEGKKVSPYYMNFKDLPQPVRDTLTSLHNHFSIDDSAIEIIDLSGKDYSIKYDFLHTWLMKTTIYNPTHHYTTKEHLPIPVIVYNDILYISKEYNFLIAELEDTYFRSIKLN